MFLRKKRQEKATKKKNCAVIHKQTGNHITSEIYYSNVVISITIKVSTGLNALSLPLWHSISFDFFLQIHRNFQVIENAVSGLQLFMESPMDARWQDNANY